MVIGFLEPFSISTHSPTRRLTVSTSTMWFVSIFQLTAPRGGWPSIRLAGNHYQVISTHSPTRRLTIAYLSIGCNLIFQLTAPRGGWPGTLKESGTKRHFNSQPHEEADRRADLERSERSISTHSPTRRLTGKKRGGTWWWIFQLTAPRGGWRVSDVTLSIGKAISTHSPTRRLTSLFENFSIEVIISTHSPTRRLTAILNKNNFI